MDIEEITPIPQILSPSPTSKLCKTPSTSPTTHLSACNPEDIQSPMVSEFSIDMQITSLTRLLKCNSLNEKENSESERRGQHVTDRFIPLRRDCGWNAIQQIKIKEEVGRGKEMVEEKITLDEMYKCLLLEKSTNKVLLFDSPAQKLTTHKGKKTHLNMNLEMDLSMSKADKKHILYPSQAYSQIYPSHASSSVKPIQTAYRKISKTPFKVLDAPNLQDDFYLNLLEWSPQNILSVALDSSLYFWNANNNRVQRFCELAPDSISSIGWNANGSQICIGNSRGAIEIWDAHKSVKINQYLGHSSRVSSVAWSNHNLLASGSRDRSIHLRDLRDRPNHIYSKYEGHTQEVCGLKWSFDGNLLASGGNDNKLFIWSTHSSTPISKFSQHCAAVKGIAWSPHNHGVLASGGGSADKTIKFWNILDSTLLDSIDTGSQVCNLLFSKNTKQIISTHGYSNNEIIVWKYPSLQKLSTLTGHSSRVLFLAMNPTGQTIVTGAGDETLRFWNVFPSQTKKESKSQLSGMMELR